MAAKVLTRQNGVLTILACLAVWAVTSTTMSAQLVIVRPPRIDPETFVSITAGDEHTCARKANGNIYCWGHNDYGQLGTGGGDSDRMAFVMAGYQVEAGATHTCAINFGSGALCWGSNLRGELGANASLAVGYDRWFTPVAVDGGMTFYSIGAGRWSSCGTTSTGVFCWGDIMTTTLTGGTSTPRRVDSYTGYSNISVGYQHACATYTWNGSKIPACWIKPRTPVTNIPTNLSGTWGQSALDPNLAYLVNSDAKFLVGPASTLFGWNASRVATQRDFTCVDQANGTVQCVGENTDGQLGAGTFGVPPDKFTPKTVDTSALTASGTLQGTLHGVSTGVRHACAIDDAGQAYCWGDGGNGKLGRGIGITSDSAVPQLVAGGLSFRAIAAGGEHTCAIATNNQIFCWGDNSFGQIGLGDSRRVGTDQHQPFILDYVR